MLADPEVSHHLEMLSRCCSLTVQAPHCCRHLSDLKPLVSESCALQATDASRHAPSLQDAAGATTAGAATKAQYPGGSRHRSGSLVAA